jgi:hypothetical protein
MPKLGRRQGTRSMEPQTVIDEVLNIHEAVRFAALFDWKGRKVAGGMKSEVRSLDPPKKAARVDRATAQYTILLASNRQFFGEFEFMYAQMKRVNAIVLQAGPEMMLCVTTNPPIGYDLIPKIEGLLREHY